MATKSTIAWTQKTWNPLAGCTRVSSGCENCYAEKMSRRLAKMAAVHPETAGRKSHYLKVIGQNGHWNHRIALIEEALADPLRWRKPSVIFVNSMSDLFHEEVPLAFILRVFAVMQQTPRHTYQVLTKRAERLREFDAQLPWLPNIWMGVSVETEKQVSRIDDLRGTHAAVKFLSLEPLLGPLPGLDLKGIDWVITGGESGSGARSMDAAWVRDIRDQCVRGKVPFFFKQWGKRRNNPDATDPSAKAKKGGGSGKGGHMLDGRIWDETPKGWSKGSWSPFAQASVANQADSIVPTAIHDGPRTASQPGGAIADVSPIVSMATEPQVRHAEGV